MSTLALAEMLARVHADRPDLESPIIDCAGPSPRHHHRDHIRSVLTVLR